MTVLLEIFFLNLHSLTLISAFCIIGLSVFVFLQSRRINKLYALVEELKKNKENFLKNAEKKLEEKKRYIEQIEEKNKEHLKCILELEEEVGAWKKVLASKIPVQAGYYIANKSIYDSFRTPLQVLNCTLEITLVNHGDSMNDFNLKFTWKFTVLNSNTTPIKKARFIYSDDENGHSNPIAMVNGESARVAIMSQKKAIGDDRFVEIIPNHAFEQNKSSYIQIEYTLINYKFNKKYDFVWLVPDALGFAGVSEFCIRFFCEGNAIRETTEVVLRSYQLNNEYLDKKDEMVQIETYQNGEKAFVAKRTDVEELKRHGFLFILINNRDELPDYLRNVPEKNNR